MLVISLVCDITRYVMNIHLEQFGDHATMAFSGEFLQTLNLKAEDKNTNEDWQLQVWGTPWTPDEFVDMSVAGHPAKL